VLATGALHFPYLIIGECASIGPARVVEAESNHSFGPVMVFDRPRRIEMVPSQIGITTISRTSKTHFLSKLSPNCSGWYTSQRT
jgi:hypothetical protein